MTTPTPFPMIERAVKALLETQFDITDDTHVGGDLSYDASDDYYIWIGIVPGGRSSEIDGTWVIDIDVFDSHYSQAMDLCLQIEAFLLRSGGHRTPTMRLDNVYQNEGPAERPWDDESAFRIGATYVFTARRSG